jgi:hypothetical protein
MRDRITGVGAKRPGESSPTPQDIVICEGNLLIVSDKIDAVEAFAKRT